jgi:hypothetical protein
MHRSARLASAELLASLGSIDEAGIIFASPAWHVILHSRVWRISKVRKHSIGLAATILWIFAAAANAQEAPTPRYEIGAQVASPYLREFSHVLGRRSEISVGGRFTLNLNNLLAAEAQADLYPDDKFFDDRRKIQGLFGIRAGVRKGRVGLFGKVRPGFIHVRDRLRCFIPEGCAPGVDLGHVGRFWLALDAGAVIEVYPSQRVALRVDAGDLFVRRFNSTDGTGRRSYYSSHNLQTVVGAALRF